MRRLAIQGGVAMEMDEPEPKTYPEGAAARPRVVRWRAVRWIGRGLAAAAAPAVRGIDRFLARWGHELVVWLAVALAFSILGLAIHLVFWVLERVLEWKDGAWTVTWACWLWGALVFGVAWAVDRFVLNPRKDREGQ